MSRRLTAVVVAALAVAGALVGAVGSGRAGALPALASDPLSAAIYPGSCRRPEDEPVYALSALTQPDEEAIRGLPFVSETELDVALPALQSDSYALVVSHANDDPADAVACGDLNSATTADGSTMLVGMFEHHSSLHTGIAVLTADDEQTMVKVYIARALTDGFGIDVGIGGEDEPEAEVTNAVTVTVTDDELTADTTQLEVGSTVAFTVVNEGDERHEVVLEERGDTERPLEIDDSTQAETEDLAPGEEARFVYTFDDAGAFQLADHIGNHYEEGLVLDLLVVDA
jgi:uncharacterized cupredoxin-like copper-binding protein